MNESSLNEQSILTDASRPLAVSFVAGEHGVWAIERVEAVKGEGLDAAARLSVIEGALVEPHPSFAWVLHGHTSNARYTTRAELDQLARLQQGLARPEATSAALIPMRKSAAWWALAQDERRAIFEEQSHHIAIGMEYLPAIARRLHHSRELGQPFDFLTWFEFAPGDTDAFGAMLARLRQNAEWSYVEREVDIRLFRA
jgi:chlorite dismutase